jgi:predicted metal-dependent phosphoesterase TrpH
MDNELLKMKVDGLRGIVITLGETVDESWLEIDAHPGLDDDDRAALVRHFETIEEALSDARKIVGVSSENDT